MGAPQILMLIWAVLWCVAGLVKIGRDANLAQAPHGAVVLAVSLYLILQAAFHGLLYWGGFWS